MNRCPPLKKKGSHILLRYLENFNTPLSERVTMLSSSHSPKQKSNCRHSWGETGLIQLHMGSEDLAVHNSSLLGISFGSGVLLHSDLTLTIRPSLIIFL